MPASDCGVTWDYIFVGAGPAALAAAYGLGRRSPARMLILDAGDRFSRRGCPGLKAQTCISCRKDNGCRVSEGVGGASAGFGNKLCHFPASQDVLSLVPHWARTEVIREAAELLGGTSGGRALSNVCELGLPETRKHYTSEILWREDYRRRLNAVINKVESLAEIRANTAVVALQREDRGGFRLQLDTGGSVNAENVVIASGRSGHILTRTVLRDVGVPFLERGPDIGIRLEAESRFFSDEFLYQTDPKYKFRWPDLGDGRTFCTCKGGSIVPVKHGSAYFADGAFESRDSGLTNLALMVRSLEPMSQGAVEEWCSRVNSMGNGSLLLTEIDVAADGPERLKEAVCDMIPWPSHSHQQMMRNLLDGTVSGRFCRMFALRCGQPAAVRVYGPAIDLYWPQPELGDGFLSPVPGLSIIGDAAGRSRGIVQAISSGLSWAKTEVYRNSLCAVANP